MRRFLRVLADAAVPAVLLLAFFSASACLAAKKNGGLPTLFGSYAVEVLSDSMSASGIGRGDTVLVKRVRKAEELQTGDIIAYYRWKSKGSSPVVLHEIVQTARYNGILYFQTKGSSNAYPDVNWVRQDSIIGRYSASSGAAVAVLSFLGSPQGLVCVSVVPSGILTAVLLLETIGLLDLLLYEKRILAGKMQLSDPVAVKKAIGLGMSRKNKEKVMAGAKEEDKELYLKLLYGEPRKIDPGRSAEQ